MQKSDRIYRIRRLHWFKLATFIIIIASLFAALLMINNLLVSLVVATVISYLVTPIISYLESRGSTRLAAILAVFSVFTLFSVAVITLVMPMIIAQFESLRRKLPSYIDGSTKILDRASAWSDSYISEYVNLDLASQISTWMVQGSNRLFEGIPHFLTSSAAIMLLSPILGFFILKDGRRLSRDLLRLVPNDYFELILNLQSQISLQIGQFIRARLLEAAIVGLIVLLGLWLIGFPYPILLAIFAGLTNLIPYIGPIIGAIPALVIAIINQEPALFFSLVLSVYVVAQLVDMFFIIPLVVARIVNLHPITVILVVILGAELLGILGMIISIPVASACKVTFTSIYRHLTDYTT